MSSTGAMDTVQVKSKRRMTVLFAADPTAASTPVSPSVAAAPCVAPPVAPLEVLATALAAYAAGEQSLDITVAMVHAAGKAILEQADGPQESPPTAAREAGRHDPDTEVPPDEAYLSLEDDDFSDREDKGATSSKFIERKRNRLRHEYHPAPLAISQRPQTCRLSIPKSVRTAATAWASAAVRCVAAGDTASLRTAITLAEETVDAVASPQTSGLLAWCCTQYAAVCEDPTLRDRLEEHAASLLDSAANTLKPGGASWVRVTEIRAWRDALAGDVDGAARAGEAVLRHQPRNPILCCLVALMRSAMGDIEGCASMLEWCSHRFPACVPARGLLVRVWSLIAVTSGQKAASYRAKMLAAVQSLLRDIRALEMYARGFASGPNSEGASTHTSPSIGHASTSWSSTSATCRRVVYSYVLLSEVCLDSADLLPVADAATTAALEWVTTHACGEHVAGWSTPSLVASVVVLRGLVVLAMGGAHAKRNAADLFDQGFAIDPTYRGDHRACSLVAQDAAEELLLRRYAARCDPRNPVAAMRLARSHEAVGDTAAACDVLLAAVDSSTREPIYPISRLAPWFEIL